MKCKNCKNNCRYLFNGLCYKPEKFYNDAYGISKATISILVKEDNTIVAKFLTNFKIKEFNSLSKLVNFIKNTYKENKEIIITRENINKQKRGRKRRSQMQTKPSYTNFVFKKKEKENRYILKDLNISSKNYYLKEK